MKEENPICINCGKPMEMIGDFAETSKDIETAVKIYQCEEDKTIAF